MGDLVYVMGASGAGKDTLISYARNALNGSASILFVHRYITRLPYEGGENHQYVSRDEFLQRREAGFFDICWDSHDSYYGIGIEIEAWMAARFTVDVNGSRQYLPADRLRYLVCRLCILQPENRLSLNAFPAGGGKTREKSRKG